jgi:hypothetical protein
LRPQGLDDQVPGPELGLHRCRQRLQLNGIVGQLGSLELHAELYHIGVGSPLNLS